MSTQTTPSSRFWRYAPLIAFLVSGCVALGLAVGTPKELVTKWFHASGYYLVFASFVLWVILSPIRRDTLPELRHWLREHWLGVVVALAMVVIAFIVSPPRLRVLADETNLLGVALDMYEARSFRNPTEVIYFNEGMRNLVAAQWDSRPLGYPFLIHLVHAVTGYRSQANGFAVSGIAGFVTLVAFYSLAARYTRPAIALVGTALLGAFPLNVLWMTCCGYEMTSLALATIAFLAFDNFLRERNGASAMFLLASALVASQGRHESAVLGLILLGWLPFVLPRSRWHEIGWGAVPIPYLFITVIWHRRLVPSSMHQLPPGIKEGFHPKWLGKNLYGAFDFFTSNKPEFAAIPFVFWGAAIGLGALVWLLIRYRKELGLRRWAFATSCILVVVANLTILTSYYWGDLRHAFFMRMAVVYTPFLVAAFMVAIHVAVPDSLGSRRVLAVGTAAALLYYWPVASANAGVRTLTLFREHVRVLRFLEEKYPDKNVVIVGERANLYAAQRYSAVSVVTAKTRPDFVMSHARLHVKREVIAIQVIRNTGKATDTTDLGPRFSTSKLWEMQNDGASTLRISRLSLLPEPTKTPPPHSRGRRPPRRPPGSRPHPTTNPHSTTSASPRPNPPAPAPNPPPSGPNP